MVLSHEDQVAVSVLLEAGNIDRAQLLLVVNIDYLSESGELVEGEGTQLFQKLDFTDRQVQEIRASGAYLGCLGILRRG
jgi:hypothetical protein